MAHPARAHIHQHPDRQAQIAEATVRFMGSMRFIKLQSCVVLAWILVNLFAVALRFDPYPFILLNLAFSTQAAYAAPLILLAGNRQADKDAHRDDTEAAEVEQLLAMNSRQLEILELLHQIQAQGHPG